ncbi:latrophilin-1-like [Tropilaelaps mercedesae]|uniref:Latrophilin-1-like n=1 Tax=Tropilaelaps mercedesae TaxID=418985 RepID=A0A1V9X486_9ACAR|nr:latrophilin-1-like [Tropilaelaps mercedesae]
MLIMRSINRVGLSLMVAAISVVSTPKPALAHGVNVSDTHVEVCRISRKVYYVSLTREGLPRKATANEARELCRHHGQTLWQLNSDRHMPADNLIAHAVLNRLRNFPRVKEAIEFNQMRMRLNIIYGEPDDDSSCKLYLAGPFTNEFYTFTYNTSNCGAENNGEDNRHWFICEDSVDKTTTITSTSHRDESFTESTRTTWEETTVTSTTTECAFNATTQRTANDIKDFIDKSSDLHDLLNGVTQRVQNSRERARSLEVWQGDMFDKVEKFVQNNTTAAKNTTKQIFEGPVHELLQRVYGPEDFGAILGFIGNISMRLASYMEHTEIKETNSSSANYRILKGIYNSSFISTVLSSTVEVSGLPQGPNTESVLTHVEFVNTTFSYVLSDNRKFATKIVDFFVTKNQTIISKDGVDVIVTFNRREQTYGFDETDYQCVYYDTNSKCSMWVGVIVHYCFLTSIFWMALEGIHTGHIMLNVFSRFYGHNIWYLGVGYVCPLLPPLSMIAIFGDRAYVQSHQLCFANRNNSAYWFFLGPLMLAVTINLIVLGIVLYRLRTVNRSPGLASASNAVSGAASRTTRSEMWRYLWGVLCMSVLLGLQWIFGILLYVMKYSGETVMFICAMLFVLLCMLQNFVRPPPPKESSSGKSTNSSQLPTGSSGDSSKAYFDSNNNRKSELSRVRANAKLSKIYTTSAPASELD